MILENIIGALLGPKGMRLYAYNDHSIEKMVFILSSLMIYIL
jgi:hypothetical protein